MQVWPGNAYPLGATYDGSGTNFALFSEVAERVELCLFDAKGAETRVDLPEMDGFVWHAFVPGVEPGQHYGYRVYGPYDPKQGLRCNPAKLLLDPYAKAIDGHIDWHPSLFSYDLGRPDTFNTEDSAAHLPKSVVINPYFDWGVDRPPRHQYADSVIYEAHVKGLTKRHPEIPAELRGTYAAIAHPVVLEHLSQLGVTAVELMPVHHFVDDSLLVVAASRTTGATTPSATSRRTCATRRPPVRVARCRSSRRWCAPCTRPISRSSSTSSTTTLPKATTSARRWPSAASTIARTTAWSTTTRSTTWTTRAPATP